MEAVNKINTTELTTEELTILANGNELNVNKVSGNSYQYTGCVDTTDSNGNKSVIVEFCYYNSTSTSTLPREISRLKKEAKKLGYLSILFKSRDGNTDTILLNRGFVRVKETDDNRPIVFRYAIDREKEKLLYTPWLTYMEVNPHAVGVWNRVSTEDKEYIHKLLVLHTKDGSDPELHNLYGAIDTLLTARVEITSINNLSNLYAKAREINALSIKKERAREDSVALVRYLGVSHNEELRLDLEKVLLEVAYDKYHSSIVAVLDRHGITYDNNVTFNNTFVFGLERDRQLEVIGKLDDPSFPYTAYSLLTKAEMARETATLKHCVGDSDFYLERVRKGETRVISLREGDDPSTAVPKWTIEYNIKKRSIEQFKGGGDVPVNSLPNNEELVFSILRLFNQNGLPVERVNESFDYIITYDNTLFRYEKIDNTTLRDRVMVREGNRRKYEILSGSIVVDQSFTKEEVLELSKMNVKLDLTDATEEVKDSIEEVSGDLVDRSTTVSYKKLRRVGGYASFYKLQNAEGLNSLTSIGGNARFDNLQTTKGLNALTSIGESASFISLQTAEGLNTLTSIGGNAWFGELQTAEGLNTLTSIGEYAGFNNLQSAKGLNSLTSIGGSAWFDKLQNAEGLNSLTSIGWNARFDNLQTAEGLNSLTSIGGSAWFDKLQSILGLEKLTKIVGEARFNSLSKDDLDKILRQIGRN